MTQKQLFHSDEYDALLEDARAIGIKELTVLLKGEQCDIDKDSKWVSNCMDRARDQKFDAPHYTIIVNAARKVGSFAYITYLMRESYFEPPVPKVYDAEVAKVGSQLSTLFEEANKLTTYLGKLKEQVKK